MSKILYETKRINDGILDFIVEEYDNSIYIESNLENMAELGVKDILKYNLKIINITNTIKKEYIKNEILESEFNSLVELTNPNIVNKIKNKLELLGYNLRIYKPTIEIKNSNLVVIYKLDILD